MSDNIFKEIDEQYRQEQLLHFWHRNAGTLITVLVLAIAVSVAIGYWQTERIHKKENETYALAHALARSRAEGVDPAAAAKIFAEASAHTSGDRLVALTLSQASAEALAGDSAGAIREYDSVAHNTDALAPERSLAEISSLALQLDTGDAASLSARLDKLAGDDNAWRFSAREYQALLALRTGDKAKAYEIASKLAKDKDAPDAAQRMAAQIAAISQEGLPSPDETAPAAPTVTPPTQQK